MQFAKCNWVSEDAHYSKCQPWRERQCSWHLPVKAKGKGSFFLREISGILHSTALFCSPVTVLPLSIWGENRMTNRACSCDVSKIVNVRAVKPILGEEAEGSAVAFWPEGPDWWELHPWLLIWGLQRRGTTGLDNRTTYFWVVKYILSKALGSWKELCAFAPQCLTNLCCDNERDLKEALVCRILHFFRKLKQRFMTWIAVVNGSNLFGK